MKEKIEEELNNVSHTIKTLIHLLTQIKMINQIGDKVQDMKQILDSIKLEGYYEKFKCSNGIENVTLEYCILLSNSFIDEYQEFTPVKFYFLKERVSNIKIILSPIFKKVNSTYDIKKYRNILLAHNFRIKGKSFFDKEVEKFKFNIPNNHKDIQVLIDLFTIVTSTICQEFIEITYGLDMQEKMIDKIEFINNPITSDDVISIKEEVIKLRLATK